MPNTLFAVGSNCPSCAAVDTLARLTPDKPQIFVRLEGNPLITGTRYVAPVTRCPLCLERFYSPVPESIKKAPKYDVSCGTSLAIGRYYLGLPMYRMEQSQSMQGIPVQDSTQWDILKKMHLVVSPAFNALTELAGNGSLMMYDDTTGRIIENKVKGLATHTTAFISVVNGHKVHLFLTGREVAGENASRILEQRTSEEPVIAMMDASAHNIPKRLQYSMLGRFILCFCLVHGRRKFFEVFNFFDKECDFVLQIISQVYAHDNYCKQQKCTASERLLYHQKHSQGLMQTLYAWLNNQLLYEHTESNGGLGVAVRYMLRHWEPLTTFLRVAGAPLDSNWAERAIKIAIRHRRNSLFYRTTHGALVGDCLMSLIYTAQENHINPYDYLNALQRHPEAVQASPKDWLPWNYTQALANRTQAA
ncbi:TPA: transposase [Legionella pneumophila]